MGYFLTVGLRGSVRLRKNQSENLCTPQSLCLQNTDNDYILKGFDAQIKTDMEVQLLSVTSWLSSSA